MAPPKGRRTGTRRRSGFGLISPPTFPDASSLLRRFVVTPQTLVVLGCCGFGLVTSPTSSDALCLLRLIVVRGSHRSTCWPGSPCSPPLWSQCGKPPRCGRANGRRWADADVAVATVCTSGQHRHETETCSTYAPSESAKTLSWPANCLMTAFFSTSLSSNSGGHHLIVVCPRFCDAPDAASSGQ